MKLFAFFVALSSSVCCMAQGGSYLVTTEGKKIEIVSDDVEFTEDHISFSSPEKKKEYMKQSEVQLLVIGEKRFENLPIVGDKRMRLQEVIAVSKGYKLTEYWDDGMYYYIFDKDNKQVEGKIKYYNKKSGQELEIIVRKYFKDCKELINHIQANKGKGADLFTDVHNLQCL